MWPRIDEEMTKKRKRNGRRAQAGGAEHTTERQYQTQREDKASGTAARNGHKTTQAQLNEECTNAGREMQSKQSNRRKRQSRPSKTTRSKIN